MPAVLRTSPSSLMGPERATERSPFMGEGNLQLVQARRVAQPQSYMPMRVLGQDEVIPDAGSITVSDALEILDLLRKALPPLKAAALRGEDVPCLSEYEIADELRRRLEAFIGSATRNSKFSVSEEEVSAVDSVIMCASIFPTASSSGELGRVILWGAIVGIGAFVLFG